MVHGVDVAAASRICGGCGKHPPLHLKAGHHSDRGVRRRGSVWELRRLGGRAVLRLKGQRRGGADGTVAAVAVVRMEVLELQGAWAEVRCRLSANNGQPRL